MIAIDGLQAINHDRGLLAGDTAIVETAKLLQARTRASDLVARIGGDEFAVLLPAATSADAHVVAAALSGAAQEAQRAGTPRVTLSVGIGAVECCQDSWGVFDSAKRAMDEVKRTGGNGYASTGSRRA